MIIELDGEIKLSEHKKAIIARLKEWYVDQPYALDGEKVLAQAIVDNLGPMSLYLTGVSINASNIRPLLYVLDVDNSLLFLHIHHSNVSAEAVEKIASTQSAGWASVKTLDVTNCDIDAQGAQHLARMLKENKQLEYVLLPGNKLGNEGAGAFAEAIEKNRTLKKLKLDANDITTEGISKLACAKIGSDVRLGIKGNSMFGETIQKSRKAIDKMQFKNLCDTLDWVGRVLSKQAFADRIREQNQMK